MVYNCATDDQNDILTGKLVTYLICKTYQITDNGSSTEDIEKTDDSIENDVCPPCPGLVRWALQINAEYSGINS